MRLGAQVVFGFLPVHLRMPGVAAISFGYVCLLSFTRGAYEADAEEGGAGCAGGAAVPTAGRQVGEGAARPTIE